MTFRERVVKEHPDALNDMYPAGVKGCPCHYGYEDEPALTDKGGCYHAPSCNACWDREIPEERSPRKENGTIPRILDSGERRQFETGAVRDIQEGKGRCDLMPLEVVAECFRLGEYAPDPQRSEIIYWTIKNIADFKNSDYTQTSYLYQALSVFYSAYDYIPTTFLEVAKHFEEGAKKYGENNWQKGLPVKCYIDSAVRHYLKWLRGDKDEPHDRAFVWNLMCCIWEVDFSPRAKEMANLITPIKAVPAGMVRYGDCPAGLFEYSDEGVFVKTEILDGGSTTANTMIAVHVNSGATRCFDNDVLVRPIDSPFTDERRGDE